MDVNKDNQSGFRFLLKKDRKFLFIAVSFIISLIVSVVFLYNSFRFLGEEGIAKYPIAESIYNISKSLGVSPGTLKRELNVGLNAPGRMTIHQLGISQGNLNLVVKKTLFREEAKNFKISIFFSLALFGLLVLLYINNKYNPVIKLKTRWSVGSFYIPVLGFVVIVGGFILGKSPNPMESTVKGIKFLFGFGVTNFNVVLLILFIIFSVIANKIICGWACPFGALQELIYTLSSRVKKYILPFWLTNMVRVIILFLSVLVLFGLFGRAGEMIYHYINPFNIFVPYFKMFLVGLSILVFLGASLFLYRPFCQLVCPFGLLSWLLERIAIFKVRIDHKKCVKCKKCFRSCPTGAIKDKVEGKALPAECFSCGRCLEECPFKAIGYK